MEEVAPVGEVVLSMRNIGRHFARGTSDISVLSNVDLTLREGEIVGILGRSGCGKSTLLRIIAGLIKPSSGEITYRDAPVAGPVDGAAMVFQTFALFPWLTVLENVQAGLEAKSVPDKESLTRALRAIDLIGLDGFESAYPREISGGMRQRVGFARALVVEPTMLLMDEPFSALDVLTAENLRTDLIELWSEHKLPIRMILLVTHNIEEAVFMCDRILIFSSNPGRVVDEIAVPFPHPRNRLDSAFRDMVDDIYAKMTARPGGTTPDKPHGLQLSSPLPDVSINTMAGLLEAVAAAPYSGRADLPVIAETLHLPVDELFPIVELLHYLGFAELQTGDILLSPAGKSFAEVDSETRKKIFAEHILATVPLVHLIKRVLDERPEHRAPRIRFEEELEDHMTDAYAETALDRVINWGRYAELFAYDDETETFSLENPTA